jgi:hypothetical protein
MAHFDPLRTSILVDQLEMAMNEKLPGTIEQFDPKLVQPILDDLHESTRGECPMVRLELDVSSGKRALRGVANRAGLLRLGVALAKAATQSDVQVVVHGDGWVEHNSGDGLIEIVITEDPWPQPPVRRRMGKVGFVFLGLVITSLFTLAVIGGIRVAQWMAH